MMPEQEEVKPTTQPLYSQCPLFGMHDCRYIDCGMWDAENNMCSVRSIAWSLSLIFNELQNTLFRMVP